MIPPMNLEPDYTTFLLGVILGLLWGIFIGYLYKEYRINQVPWKKKKVLKKNTLFMVFDKDMNIEIKSPEELDKEEGQ
jgi:hypothetical protein